MVSANAKNLVWARETAGLEISDAARRVFSKSSKGTPEERLSRLEAGTDPPTQKQLLKLAKIYHIPVAVFYLNSPPRRSDRVQDFRTLPQQSEDKVSNARLQILVSDVIAAQSLARELLVAEEAPPLPFVGSSTFSDGYETVARSIIEILGFDLDRYRRPSNADAAFKYLRNCIQDAGIFVLLISDLGHPPSNTIPVSVFRGFALADNFAPFIVINRKDNRLAQSFTALHEVAHLWLGSSGITGFAKESVPALERFCNRVAGSILLPSHELSEFESARNDPIERVVTRVSQFAGARNLSREMVRFNLWLEDYIGRELWTQMRAGQRLDRTQNRTGLAAVNPNVVKRSALGEPLLDLARRSIESGSLTRTKASVLLGVNPRKVASFLNPNSGK